MEKAKIAIKPPTELEKQVEILKKRGLFFDNDTEAIRTLEHINYYRLRGCVIYVPITEGYTTEIFRLR